MVIYCLCLIAGAYSLELFPELQPPVAYATLILLAAVASLLRPLRIAAFLCLGLATMGLAADAELARRLDPVLVGTDLGVTVRIADFPERRGVGVRLVVQPTGATPLPPRLRLTWQSPAVVPRLGETWRLQVRLRPPRGYSNPAGFDYEGWLFRERVGAIGYVVGERHNYRLTGAPTAAVDRIRRHVVERISILLPRDEAASVLLAIVVGARQWIERQQWERYARTGTSHLMAISGLHIGLAAGSASILAWAFGALLTRRRNLRDLALFAAVAVAAGYAALSGFAVPAQRAFVMAALGGWMILWRRRLRLSAVLAGTCLLVFLANPLSILAPGFKLSFAAVAILFSFIRLHITVWVGSGCRSCQRLTGRLAQLGCMQLMLLTGLAPLTVLLFDRISLAAPLVNLLVLPLFNVVAVPCALLGGILDGPLSPAGDRLLSLAHRSIEVMLHIVGFFSKQEFLSFGTADVGLRPAILLPLLHVLTPPGWPGRRLAYIALVWTLVFRPAPPPGGCLGIHTLDVGQGLAVVLQTRSRTLLFDTGPAFAGGGDTAELVIAPFLQSRGISRIDTMVVSHGDLDHAGGVQTLIGRFAVGKLMVGEPVAPQGVGQLRCVDGQSWRWDGIDFRIVHPRPDTPWKGNNASCVLSVTAGRVELLFTGDIETPVERLLAYRGRLDQSDVVWVPHHGSRTSSSAALVEATRPAYAIVSTAFGNRWGFPRAAVVDRWQQVGATVLNTGTSGAISQRICHDGIQSVVENRVAARKYWHHAPLRGH